MVTFLFWNIKKKPLQVLIANLARKHQVDILMLAECDIPPGTLLLGLNAQKTEYDYAISNGCEKIKIFTRFSGIYTSNV
jgi:hypothetical protein